MAGKTINIGYNSFVTANKILAVVNPESAPVRRLVATTKKGGSLIDATFGHKTRAVIVSDTGQVILSSLLPETIAQRLEKKGVL